VKKIVAALASVLVLCLGCASTRETIVVTGEGRKASDVEVDRDAFRLLPPGAVVWFRADAPLLFESSLGPEVVTFMKESLPFASGAAISPKDDIELVVGAMYATVGSDVVLICKGDFQKEATAKAISERPVSVSNQPIVSIRYSGAEMYVVDQVAMSILTDRTMVFGSQLGVRRVLERVEEDRLDRNIPPWFEALLADEASAVQVGIDLDAQPIPATLGEKVTFMKGLRAARILGNFKNPGLNLAGTLTYKTPQEATQAAETLSGLKEELDRYELLIRALGISQPLRRVQAEATDKDTQVTLAIEGAALSKMLENSSQLMAGSEAGDWLPN
jgi:hypothetical protein